MFRRSLRPALRVLAFAVAIAMFPVAAIAAVSSFTSSTTTPAVSARNYSSAAGAKAVWGYEEGTGSTSRYGVYGSAAGSGGIGVAGSGAQYGVLSNGNLGVAGGTIQCTKCVTAPDVQVPAVSVYEQAFQFIPTGTTTQLNWDHALFDNAGMYRSTGLVAPEAGVYEVTTRIRWFGNWSTVHWVEIDVKDIVTGIVASTASNSETYQEITILLLLKAGESVLVKVNQDSGSTQQIGQATLDMHFVTSDTPVIGPSPTPTPTPTPT